MIRALRREDGISLAEVLVAVVIMGLALVTIVTGFGTALLAANSHEGTTKADLVARAVAEAVQNAGYQACSSSPDYSGALSAVTFPAGWGTSNVTALTVSGWNGGTATGFTACPAPDNKLEKVHIEVTAPGDRGARTLEIYKRSPA